MKDKRAKGKGKLVAYRRTRRTFYRFLLLLKIGIVSQNGLQILR